MDGVNAAKNMDSVFASAIQDDMEFDAVFGDQEDSLVDTVNGVNESGDPLTGVDWEDLHQDHDDATPEEVRDGEAKDNDMGNKDAEGTEAEKPEDNSVKGEVGKESEADKVEKDADQKYQDGKDCNGTKPDPDNLNDNIEKVAEGDEASEDSEDDIDVELLDDDGMSDEDLIEAASGEVSGDGIDGPDRTETEDGDGKVEPTDIDGDIKDQADDNKEELEKDAPPEEKPCTEEAEADVDSELADGEPTEACKKEGCKGGCKSVKESDELADSDVQKVDNDDNNDEDNLVDEADDKKEDETNEYEYDPSDEDIINMAIGQNND